MTRMLIVHRMMLAAIGAVVLTTAGAAAAAQRETGFKVLQGPNSDKTVSPTVLATAHTKSRTKINANRSVTHDRTPRSEDGPNPEPAKPIELTIFITESVDGKFAVEIDVEDDEDPQPDFSASESDANVDPNGDELWTHLDHVIADALKYMADKKE